MKATREQYQYKHYLVTARFLKEVDGWDHEKKNEHPLWHNRFTVTVKNTETGLRRSFQFTDSINNWQLGKSALTSDDLKSALSAFLSDANAGLGSFDNFCSEMGYDTDSRSAYAIYGGCNIAAEKVNALGLDPVDDYNALND